MNTITDTAIAAIGTPMADGFYAGRIKIDGQLFALIVAPKFEGEYDDTAWNGSRNSVAGAMSYYDGLTNTNVMADAGSELAKWARGLRIGGHDDWYLPSQDELEILYRNFKPTTAKNYLYARSGINLSADVPTYPYTIDIPAQTQGKAFQEGGSEAFDTVWYWSSTQHAGYSYYAWCQDFINGGQHNLSKHNELRARAVRRLIIQ